MKRSVCIKVFGKVQGVCYRDFVRKQAIKLGIQGTVQNYEDGSILIYATGLSDKLDDFIDLLYKGSPKSKVESVDVEPMLQEKDFRGVFRVIGFE